MLTRQQYILYVAFSGLGLVVSFFVGSRTLSKEHQEFKTGLREMKKQQHEDSVDHAASDVVDEEKPPLPTDSSGSDGEPRQEKKPAKKKRAGFFFE